MEDWTLAELAAAVRAAPPWVPDDPAAVQRRWENGNVSLTADGRRLDTQVKVVGFIAEVELERRFGSAEEARAFVAGTALEYGGRPLPLDVDDVVQVEGEVLDALEARDDETASLGRLVMPPPGLRWPSGRAGRRRARQRGCARGQ